MTQSPGERATGAIIEIKLPLPMPVVGTLMKLIGTAWPDAQLGDDSYGRGMTFIIPKGANPKRFTKAAVKAIVDEHASNSDDLPDVLEIGPNGMNTSVSRQVADLLVVAARESLTENPDAVNYTETLVTDRENGTRYVMIFARSPHQTPHQLRMAAEGKLERALERNGALEAELARYRGPVPVNRIAEASARHDYESSKAAADPAWEDLDETTRSSRTGAAMRSAAAIAAALDTPDGDDLD